MAFPKCADGGGGGDSSGPSDVFAVGTYSFYIHDDRMVSSNFIPGTIVLHDRGRA